MVDCAGYGQYPKSIADKGLAVCVGEFVYRHTDGDVDEETIISHCAERGIGWLAWSWYDNSGGVEYLDLVTSPEGWNSKIQIALMVAIILFYK